jgi:hypothetical protein
MATAAPSPNDLTRQQLDELDSLLQRMLSLPLSPPESFAPNAPAQAFAPIPVPVPPPVTPAPVPAPLPVPVPAPAPRVFADPVPEPPRPAPEPVPVVPVPAAELWKAPEPVAVPRPVAAPVPQVETPAPAKPAPLPFAEPVPAAPPSEPVPVLFAPLVAFNAVLNWVLGLFGFPGRVLRSGFVKNLFGLAGLGLLVYTALKVAQIHGLVSLPVPLPWPR